MRALIQRVSQASVTIDDELFSEIGQGILVLLGVEKGDTKEQADKLVEKIINLRIFEDENEKMNLSIKDINGELMIVSQFTLCSDCKKGTRPSFDNAETPQKANEMYEYFINEVKKKNIPFKTGKFGAMMDISLTNNGPVTFMLQK